MNILFILDSLDLGTKVLITFLFGLIIGSFLNVVIYRLPKLIAFDLLSEVSTEEENSHKDSYLYKVKLWGRSFCPNCHKKIPFLSNIPLISFLYLKGRCFYCKSKISLRYPLVELLTAVLFSSYIFMYPEFFKALAAMIFISIVICLIFIDAETLLLLDELTLLLLWLGLGVNLYGLFASLKSAVIGAMIGYGFLWLIYWIFKLITKKEGMGYGDFKLTAAILAWLGFEYFIILILLASSLAILYQLIYFIVNSNTSLLGKVFPFGPFLGIAGLIIIFSMPFIGQGLLL